MKYVLELIRMVLPFLKKKNAKDIKEFSELVTGQYEFLALQLEKVLKDYFEMSTKVHEMHAEIFSLKAQLAEAAKLQCLSKDCTERWQ
ncbi:hypothetical protein [Bacteroides sp. 51]|uniref:hypothetical protein n=1 Tax=Bacteroides sp. 51 TaxID=2302938 RepID=UPI0013D00817|nr:hypothetical protein [Bacteroides sp. 51]NDV81843.1 hypothetical protein [Bacteroides sp. 51]